MHFGFENHKLALVVKGGGGDPPKQFLAYTWRKLNSGSIACPHYGQQDRALLPPGPPPPGSAAAGSYFPGGASPYKVHSRSAPPTGRAATRLSNSPPCHLVGLTPLSNQRSLRLDFNSTYAPRRFLRILGCPVPLRPRIDSAIYRFALFDRQTSLLLKQSL